MPEPEDRDHRSAENFRDPHPPTLRRWTRRRSRRRAVVASICVVAVAGGGVAGCGSSSSGSSGSAGVIRNAAAITSTHEASGQLPASAKQTIVWAIQGGTSGGLGAEGGQDAYEIRTFEKAHPNITVKVQTTSGTSVDTARQQLQDDFLAGDSTPDVIDADITWSALFGAAHWILPLSQLHPNPSLFFPGQLTGGTYKGTIYELPWYTNAEGVYYRTDLVKHAPATPQQLMADAQAAMKADPSLKEGLAFEGDKYEGAVTVFVDILSAFGGHLDPSHLYTRANLAALQYMRALVTDHVAPAAVTGWQETQVQDAYTGGQAAFATNWPYVLQGLPAALAKKTRYIPFPATSTGSPGATAGGDMLAINAHSKHVAADWLLIQWLLNPANQIHRAIADGDPPSVKTAYTPALYHGAPYMKEDLKLFSSMVSRPVTPLYPSMSADLQNMLSSVLSGQQSPVAALKATAAQVSRMHLAS